MQPAAGPHPAQRLFPSAFLPPKSGEAWPYAGIGFERFAGRFGSWGHVFLSPCGRLSRRDFCLAVLLVFLGAGGALQILSLIADAQSENMADSNAALLLQCVLLLPALFAYLVPLACICIKRMHDAGLWQPWLRLPLLLSLLLPVCFAQSVPSAGPLVHAVLIVSILPWPTAE